MRSSGHLIVLSAILSAGCSVDLNRDRPVDQRISVERRQADAPVSWLDRGVPDLVRPDGPGNDSRADALATDLRKADGLAKDSKPGPDTLAGPDLKPSVDSKPWPDKPILAPDQKPPTPDKGPPDGWGPLVLVQGGISTTGHQVTSAGGLMLLEGGLEGWEMLCNAGANLCLAGGITP